MDGGVSRGVVGCYLASSGVSKDMLQSVRMGFFFGGRDPTNFLLSSEKDREDLVGTEYLTGGAKLWYTFLLTPAGVSKVDCALSRNGYLVCW
jgi:hypothetical protein